MAQNEKGKNISGRVLYLMKDFIENVANNYNDKSCPVCDKKEWATLPLAGKLPVGEGDQSLGECQRTKSSTTQPGFAALNACAPTHTARTRRRRGR